ncbi:MAG: hypothetical protein ACFE9L_01010 [Candidatus Hodarchaeota archaeon]
MKTNKKFIRIALFSIFLTFVIILPTIQALGDYGTVDRDIPFKQKGNNYNVVAHGHSDDYVTIQYERIPHDYTARITYLKLHWRVAAGIFTLQSYLDWLKNTITLKVGSNSRTWIYTEIDVWDPSPYDYSGIRYILSPTEWVDGVGGISVTIKTEIRYKAWCIFYWAWRYESVVTTVYV